MSESAQDETRRIAAFGYCETCGKVRTAEVEDDDLVLLCPSGHRSDGLDKPGGIG